MVFAKVGHIDCLYNYKITYVIMIKRINVSEYLYTDNMLKFMFSYKKPKLPENYKIKYFRKLLNSFLFTKRD